MAVDVIIPVGPGHETLHKRAAMSVHMAQDNWPTKGVRVVVVDDCDGKTGRSRARNEAVNASAAEWIFFLDADDMMHPQCFEHAAPYLASKDGLSGQPVRDAVWGMCRKMEGEYVLPLMELPRITSYEVLIRHHPLMTIKIGHFVRREVAIANPFDEDMDCGEDWDYFLRVWRHHRCIKIPHPFYIKTSGNHSTGARSATGRQWVETVTAMLEKERG